MDAALAEQLRLLEERLLDPEVRHDRAAAAALLDPEFLEIGSSGRLFTREQILAFLAEEASRAQGFCRENSCARRGAGAMAIGPSGWRGLSAQLGVDSPGWRMADDLSPGNTNFRNGGMSDSTHLRFRMRR